ncbi:signal recognition particle-docking protein FtsY [Luminiphilus syltensis NOR5-1B]|uniref:Signal recognition particle receptor FtsY n=1 Tax=Luminiphilus syltensis NOR5-1B TaxID=565045 RepID=B8KU89_9GAMM|nr:signal recognition particle-docking protein FtsY [Luminiphilus syltensis]EED34773.1 signal recognition particle-docking protein FtsY [Luminiphilus syltensis NOR5-1B]
MKLFKRRSSEAKVPEAEPATSTEESASPPEPAVTPADQAPDVVPEAQHDEPPASVEGAKDGEQTGFYTRLKRGLGRTGSQFAEGLGNLFLGKKALDADLLEALEAQLLQSDLGIEATSRVIDDLTARVSRKELADAEAVMAAVRASLLDIIEPCEQPLSVEGKKPFVILVVGVNGAGKTTTIGKMANRFQREGKKVILAAGDTFRAAAVEQLQTWGERHGVPVVAQHTGADSASVLFDGLEAARARGADVLIADTAGRLQNKSHLMDELEKVVRVMRKLDPDAPHETLLVLDAGTGQNAVSQAVQFDAAIGVSGIALTKLDGTARGGVTFAIAERLRRPIRFIGIGEGAEDLRPFVARDFVDALFDAHPSRDSE